MGSVIGASRFLQEAARVSARDEDRFFANLRLANGTFKTTSRGRLDAVNALFFAVLKHYDLVPRIVHDIGISSGVTTLEWLREFERRGFGVMIRASDLNLEAYLVDMGGGWRALVDPLGHILQLEILGYGIRPWPRRRDRLTANALWRNPLLSSVRRRLGHLNFKSHVSQAEHSDRVSGPHLLVTRALRHVPNLTLTEEDILAPLAPALHGVADVVRIANLLQTGYFTADQIRTAAQSIRARCRGPGSLVILCRNTQREVEASILRLMPDGQFAVAARLAKGSEAEGFFCA